MVNEAGSRGRGSPKVVFYTRAGCHLCERALETVEKVRAERTFALDVLDIDEDPVLRETFTLEVPVIEVDGEVRFRHFLDAEAFRRRLWGN